MKWHVEDIKNVKGIRSVNEFASRCMHARKLFISKIGVKFLSTANLLLT